MRENHPLFRICSFFAATSIFEALQFTTSSSALLIKSLRWFLLHHETKLSISLLYSFVKTSLMVGSDYTNSARFWPDCFTADHRPTSGLIINVKTTNTLVDQDADKTSVQIFFCNSRVVWYPDWCQQCVIQLVVTSATSSSSHDCAVGHNNTVEHHV